MFEAGLFGGVLGMRRTFILHANGAKLPTDLLGLTCVRYAGDMAPSEMKVVNQKIRNAIENEGRVARIEGSWWQFSLTERTAKEPSALGLLNISRDRDGALEMTGRAWREDGRLSARYRSEAAKEKEGGLFYYWQGERPLDADARAARNRRNPGRKPRTAIRLLDDPIGFEPCRRQRTSGVYWPPIPTTSAFFDGTRRSKRIGAHQTAAEGMGGGQECAEQRGLIDAELCLRPLCR